MIAGEVAGHERFGQSARTGATDLSRLTSVSINATLDRAEVEQVVDLIVG
jgi:hypothetical protein